MLNNACPLRKMCAANAHFVKKTRESDYDKYFTLAEITEYKHARELAFLPFLS
ncbi:MAG: hypothetical protein ACLP9L_25260 [Thermoguttaceae bacterium]